MSRLPAAAARVRRARVPALGLLIAFTGWLGCAVDSSGLSPAGDAGHGKGGQQSASGGAGGEAKGGTGGGTTVAGTGGLLLMNDGGAGGEGGSPGQAGRGGTGGRGGEAGSVAGTGGRGGAGRGGSDGPTGSGGRDWTGGGGWTGGAGWNGNGNSGGNSGGRSGGLAMCDPDIKDNDACFGGAPSCRKTCGVSALATKPCSCAGGQWNCAICTYPSGDYSCYDLPTGFIPQCPFATMSGITSCNALCSLCSGYVDSTGASKVGYCACSQDPDSGRHVYQCASSLEWPPQH